MSVTEGLSAVSVLTVAHRDERRDSASVLDKIAKPRINSGAHRSNVTSRQIQIIEQLHGQQCE